MPRKDRTIPKVKAPRPRGVITDSDDLKKNPILNYRKYNQIVNNPSAMYSLHATDRYRLQEFVKNHSIIIPTRVNGKQTSIKIRTSVAASSVTAPVFTVSDIFISLFVVCLTT